MAFSDALSFPFRGPHRWSNLGLGMVCFLIPIVGPIVFQGYCVLIEKAVIADPRAEAPRFDFAHFSEHLKRGVPPFVVSLIMAPVLLIIVFPVFVGLMLLGAALHRPELQIALLASAVAFEVVIILLAIWIITPLTLKAGLEQSIGAAFQWDFNAGFLRRVGLKALGYQVLLMGISMLLMPLTICTLFVGAYAMMAYLMMAQAHLRAQLYLEHLALGGPPLAIAETWSTGFQPVMNAGAAEPRPPEPGNGGGQSDMAGRASNPLP